MKVVAVKKKAPDGRRLSLTIGKEYEVLGIEADSYRIITDPHATPWGSDPVLFDPGCFKITDPSEPAFWVCSYGSDGERYCYPGEWGEPGFFEHYHDGIENVRKRFWEDLRRYFPEVWKEHVSQS
jgi:hypothetical protein